VSLCVFSKGRFNGTSANSRFVAFFRHKKLFFLNIKPIFFAVAVCIPGGIPLALSSAKIIEINKMIKNISIENRWIGLCFYSIFFVTRNSPPGYRNLFLPLSPLNLILTLAIFIK
jgi:hypothetical protein